MQADAKVAAAYHLRVVVDFEPHLAHISLLPLGVPLAEDLIIHRLLGSLASHDHLDWWDFAFFVCDVKSLDKLHEVFVWCVARRA